MLANFTLSGPFVSFSLVGVGRYYDRFWSIEQYDLRTGRVRFMATFRGLESSPPLPNPLYELDNSATGSLRSIVTNRRGAVAWGAIAHISDSPSGTWGRTNAVVFVNDGAGTRVVAEYPSSTLADAPSELTLTESTVSWRHSGQQYSAPLR